MILWDFKGKVKDLREVLKLQREYWKKEKAQNGLEMNNIKSLYHRGLENESLRMDI